MVEMIIGKIAYHACIRLSKMALPLIERGHQVHLCAQHKPNFVESFHTFTLAHDVGQYANWVDIMKDHVDVFHVHNEPSWYVTLIKERCDVPVVLDVHDSYTARSTFEESSEKWERNEHHLYITPEERTNFQLADALVFPGDRFRRTVTDEFKLTQPAITLPSYVPRTLYRYNASIPWMGGLCYEGLVKLPDDTKHGFQYCDYLDMARECDRLGIDFHIYAGKRDKAFYEAYKGMARVYPHRPLTYDDLLKEISKHDWGLVGNVNPTAEWDAAMPNKLFEYMSAGVPVVAMNAADCAKFVRKEGVGIVVGSPEELAGRWNEHRECRKQVIAKRQQWTMDNNIHLLETLYERITE